MLKKLSNLVWNLLGAPYYMVKKIIEVLFKGSKKAIVIVSNGIKIIINSFSWILKQTTKFLKYIPTIIKAILKWLLKAIKESIAQIFTLLGFFIAWLTLTGSAKDIVGIAILISVSLWLLTMSTREE